MQTLKNAAKTIGVPYNSVLHHHKKGRIPVQKVGQYQLIEPEVLRSILTALKYRRR